MRKKQEALLSEQKNPGSARKWKTWFSWCENKAWFPPRKKVEKGKEKIDLIDLDLIAHTSAVSAKDIFFCVKKSCFFFLSKLMVSTKKFEQRLFKMPQFF